MTTDFLERSAQLAADYRVVQKELSEVSALAHELLKRINARSEVTE